MLDWVCRWYSCSWASRNDGNIHCTSRSSPSSSHACKPSPTPHYISHKCSCACAPHSLSFHADTSDAHDTPDTGLNPYDVCKVCFSFPFSRFLPHTPAFPSLSQNKLQTPDSHTRVHLFLLHVLPPTTVLYLLPTSRTHTSSTHLTHKRTKARKEFAFFSHHRHPHPHPHAILFHTIPLNV